MVPGLHEIVVLFYTPLGG